MRVSAKDKAVLKGTAHADQLRTLKHDVKNQLSNIHLALEQLKYEIPDASADCTFYLNSISISAAKINTLVNEAE